MYKYFQIARGNFIMFMKHNNARKVSNNSACLCLVMKYMKCIYFETDAQNELMVT